jgi:ribosomal protein S18 acetylase RimI-like enzyme
VSSPATNVQLCELSLTLDQAWRDLYTTAFPLNEQEPESKLQNLITSGRLLYHKTSGKHGELLCFSMVSLAPDFSFLAYIATDPNQRSGGYGSKHMRALLDYLKQRYPSHIGLFLEIESTNPRLIKLAEEDKKVRQRRLGFYRRLGAKRLCREMHYLAPSRTGSGETELDILFFNSSDQPLDHSGKAKIVSEIYERFYELQPGDPLVSKVLPKLTSCSHPKCEDEPADSSGSGTDSTASTADPTAKVDAPAASAPTVPTDHGTEAAK